MRTAATASRDPRSRSRRHRSAVPRRTRPASRATGNGGRRPETTPLEWATKQNKQSAVRALTERGAAERTRDQIVQRAERVVLFLQAACWDHHGPRQGRSPDARPRGAARTRARCRRSPATASTPRSSCGDDLKRSSVSSPSGPSLRGQTGGAARLDADPLSRYTRFTHPADDRERDRDRAPAARSRRQPERLLHGRRLALHRRSIGVAGEGEQDSPRQPYAAALYRAAARARREPYDIQVLYNTHFSGDMHVVAGR